MIDDPRERISALLTTLVEYTHTLRPGLRLWTQNYKPALRVCELTTELHDLQLEACNPYLNQALHANVRSSCWENFRTALSSLDLADKWIPYPIGVFRQCGEKDGRLQLLPASSRSGDYVIFRTENPITFVASACPMSSSSTNNSPVVEIEVQDHA